MPTNETAHTPAPQPMPRMSRIILDREEMFHTLECLIKVVRHAIPHPEAEQDDVQHSMDWLLYLSEQITQDLFNSCCHEKN